MWLGLIEVIHYRRPTSQRSCIVMHHLVINEDSLTASCHYTFDLVGIVKFNNVFVDPAHACGLRYPTKLETMYNQCIMIKCIQTSNHARFA